ncbi:TLC domain-containing protein At5g14285-like [Apium graveolens]|uniref:TLC domain-containing protein At5g14285-like n=1 Tax=Apium graveolens TaxID=4045 RepID=UPI003D7B7738
MATATKLNLNTTEKSVDISSEFPELGELGECEPCRFVLANSLTAAPDLLVFFSFYLTIYLLAHFLIFNNWTSKLRPEAASCLISYFHGSPAVFLAGKALLSDQNRGFASTNTTFQTLILDYSIAYFLMDLIHYLLFYPSDILFIAHHLATLFVFMTCRFVVFHGAYAVLMLLIIVEVTSFCQNTWTLACARRKDSEFADKSFKYTIDVEDHDDAKIVIFNKYYPIIDIKDSLSAEQLSELSKSCFGNLLKMLHFKFQHQRIHNLLIRQLKQPNSNEPWIGVRGVILKLG